MSKSARQADAEATSTTSTCDLALGDTGAALNDGDDANIGLAHDVRKGGVAIGAGFGETVELASQSAASSTRMKNKNVVP